MRRTIFNLLRLIEHESSTGVVHVTAADGTALGRVMAARGRLCFCAPAGGQTRIGDLLVAEDEAFRAHLDEAARDARRRNVRLCEVLLQDGRVGLQALRVGLLRQAAHGLLAIGGEGSAGPPRFDFTPARDDYDHRLTFSPLEVFMQCAALLDSAPPDWVLRLFSEYAETAEAALLLLKPVAPASLPLPLAVRGLEQASLSDLVTLARCAADMVRPAALARSVEPAVIVYRGPESVWVGGNGSERLLLLRTGSRFEAGQIMGYALRLARGG